MKIRQKCHDINSPFISTLCSSRKYPYSHNGRDWKFLGGGGLSKAQKF